MTQPALEHATLADLLLVRADDPATALLAGDQRWTWQKFVAEAATRAAVLRELRGPGPWHVGVLMDNRPEYLFLVAGAALAGATIVGVNPTRRGAELAADIAGTDIATLLVAPAYAEVLDGLDLPGVDTLAVEGERYQGLVAAARGAGSDGELPGPGHTLLLLFTSGSTGAPKAVVCSTGRLAMIAQLNTHGLTRDDIAYCAMPLFHGNAIMAAWAPILYAGGAVALRERFSASGFLPDVQRYGATFFTYVGRALSYVLAQPERAEERDNRLRLGFGTEASTRDRHEFERRFGCRVVESYGSSEGVCAIVRGPDTPDGALGVPAPQMGIEILGDDGRPCPPAEYDDAGLLRNAADAIGEIVVRGGAARFEGYYANPEATADKLRDGDYWTGDLAYRDADGTVWFAGRTADWIRVDSENFASAPIERILARFPGVRAAVVYGVPDPRTGDRVMTTLLCDEAVPFDADAFDRFLATQPDLGTKWRPTLVRIAPDLPLTASGKVDKPALRREAWLTGDPVHEWDGSAYRPLDEVRRRAIADELARHGRATQLPTGAAGRNPEEGNR